MMPHCCESSFSLSVHPATIASLEDLRHIVTSVTDVALFRLPGFTSGGFVDGTGARRCRWLPLSGIGDWFSRILPLAGASATLVVVGEVIDLMEIKSRVGPPVHYQHWIVIRRTPVLPGDGCALPEKHFGALIYTRYSGPFRHVPLRLGYTNCPFCGRTTKDYGGKKHTFHPDGTLLSDVWRDLEADLDGDLNPVVSRFSDLLSRPPYRTLTMVDCRPLFDTSVPAVSTRSDIARPGAGHTAEHTIAGLPGEQTSVSVNRILSGDCLSGMKQIPSSAIDFVFVDPPYNLQKNYRDSSDDLDIEAYLGWCAAWGNELARLLRPGCTLAILNLPWWAVEHWRQLSPGLRFQNWIVWDALSVPVRQIMPSHYTILCLSKGDPRPLPGLRSETIGGETGFPSCSGMLFPVGGTPWLRALVDGYCQRRSCQTARARAGVPQWEALTDLWADIHRLKHNSRRQDHPCQLPPRLMYRLISLFTFPGETVLDCFNGIGTTTLAAHQLGRSYLGIELSPSYSDIARARHREVELGIDPFRRRSAVPSSKNNRFNRMSVRLPGISKKALQLEVRRIARLLGHIPSREELSRHTFYPLEYYDRCFSNWSQVTAAARHGDWHRTESVPSFQFEEE